MDLKTRLLTPRVYFAVGAYLVTLAVLYLIQYPLYRGAVATIFYPILIYPPLFMVAYLGFGRFRKSKDRGEKRARALGVCSILLMGGTGLALFHFISEGGHQRLTTWQIISIVFAGAIVVLMEKRLTDFALSQFTLSEEEIKQGNFKIRVNYVSIVFISILLCTALYMMINAPATVQAARRALEQRGHTYITFAEHLPRDELPEYFGPFGAYSFTDSNDENILVDVGSGNIIE